MNDDQIIALYLDRDEQAIQATMDTYGGYCGRVAGNILKNPLDAEEVVADTWLRAWNIIPPQRPQYLRLFLGKITRNLALTRWRTNTADSRGGEITLALEELSDCIGEETNPETMLQIKELGQCISVFLKSEPQNSRVIFLRRYFYLESSKEIALHLGTSDSNVRMILFRTRKRLRDYLKKEGYFV